MIEITLKNGLYETWEQDQYTDYIYDGKCFVIVQGSKWVGIYNLYSVVRITIGR